MFVCSLACLRADCALFVVLTVRASPAWHTNGRRARKRSRRRLHRTDTVATVQDPAAYGRLREHHGSQPPRMAWTCVRCRTENAACRRMCSNSDCRFPGGPPEAGDEKRGKDNRKDKQYLPKHTWHCGDCGEDNSSRRCSCSSCGAKPPESAEFCRDGGPGTTQSSSHLADGVEVAGRQRGDRCQDRRGFERGQGQGQQQGGCQQAEKPGHPHSTASTLRPGRGRSCFMGGEETGAGRAQDTAAEPQAPPSAPAPGHGSPSEGQQGSGGVPSGKKRTSWSFQPSNVRRSVNSRPRFCSTTTGVELLELRCRTETGSAELCHFESHGVQTVTAPLSPIWWAAGFRNCLNAEARDVFDAFCKELEHSPDSDGLGPTAERPVIPLGPAPETPPSQAGAFAPFPSPRTARVDPYLAPPPQGVPWRQSSARPCTQRWMVRMTCPHFLRWRPAMHVRGAWIHFSQRILKAPRWGFRFRLVQIIFQFQRWGASCYTRCTGSSQPSQSRVLEQCGATAASLRNDLCLGDYALGYGSDGRTHSTVLGPGLQLHGDHTAPP